MPGFQKGFVSQLLLVLLLAGGIAAGTFLVQNGVNFLPKAADPGDWNWPFRCDQGDADNTSDQSAINYASDCPTVQFPKFDHCDIVNPNGNVDTNPKKISCDLFTQDFDVTYYCRWNEQCSSNAAPPVVAPAVTRKTPYCDGKDIVYPSLQETCSKGCIGKDGEATCDESATSMGTIVNVQNCTNQNHIDHCVNEAKKDANKALVTAECKLVDGTGPENTKCVYIGNTCTEADRIACGSKACVIKTRNLSGGGLIRYSECGTGTAAAPAQGAPTNRTAAAPPAGNPAAPANTSATQNDCKQKCANQLITDLSNCVIERRKCDSEGTKTNAICGNNLNTCNEKSNKSKESCDSTCSTTTFGAAPAADCGSDSLGLKIPCYIIGTFTDRESLASTEAGAALASQRYAQFKGIIDKVGSNINQAVIAAAKAKLAASKAAADACLAGR